MDNKKIIFNKKAIIWLEIRLNNQISFTSHINKRVIRAQTAGIKIKSLTKMQKQALALLQQIQLPML